jgi:DNA-binding MarR family transcriptional regulator
MIISANNLERLQSRYQNNFMRPLLALSHHVRAELMQYLQKDCGHSALKITWEPLLNGPGVDGIQIGQLAKMMAVSKQHCDQQLKAVEKAGYLVRSQDPNDGRAKLVSLTDLGQLLLKQAKVHLADQQQTFDRQLSSADLTQLHRGLKALSSHSAMGSQETPTIALLITLAATLQRRLMALTIAAGYPDLQISYEQVLNHIGLKGATMSQLAKVNNASNQAISRIVNALEDNGYVRRCHDGGQPMRILFSRKGLMLIDSACSAIDTLKDELTEQIGLTAWQAIEQTLRALDRHYNGKDSNTGDQQNTIDITDYRDEEKPAVTAETLLIALATILQPALTETAADGSITLSKKAIEQLQSSQISSAEQSLCQCFGKRKADSLIKQLKQRAN